MMMMMMIKRINNYSHKIDTVVPGQKSRLDHINNNNKRPLTPKSMPPASDEHITYVYIPESFSQLQ